LQSRQAAEFLQANGSLCITRELFAAASALAETHAARPTEQVQKFSPTGRFNELPAAEAPENPVESVSQPKLALTFDLPFLTVE
jgi:hypothetical protein